VEIRGIGAGPSSLSAVAVLCAQEVKIDANGGSLEAQKVLRLQRDDADRIAQQERDEGNLRTEPANFFEAITKSVGENSASFNSDLRLGGDYALTFVSSAGLIQLGKRANPFIFRKVIHFQAERKVVVRTETVTNRRHGVKEETWQFTVKHGELLLNGMNPLQCADALFSGLADAFR
jgi:hypothetical protein